MPFDTPLNPKQAAAFPQWKAIYAPNDSGQDYDLQGAYTADLTPDPATGHWPDTYKKPNHPTFSDQSIYSSLAGTKPGTWQGEQYTPYQGKPQGMGYGAQPSSFWGSLNNAVNSIRDTFQQNYGPKQSGMEDNGIGMGEHSNQPSPDRINQMLAWRQSNEEMRKRLLAGGLTAEQQRLVSGG
jgi:hypothetical protein